MCVARVEFLAFRSVVGNTQDTRVERAALSFRKITEKNGFVTATKLGTANEFFVASTKNFAAATKRFVDRT